MGEWWDRLTGAAARERSQAILEEKFPVTLGLSGETMAAMEAGEVEIGGGDPQVGVLRRMGGVEDAVLDS